MPRKTIAVAEFVEMMNRCLKNSICNGDIRSGMICAVEQVLHKTGNYKGFRYLLQDEVPEGERPGIIYEGDMPAPYPDRFDVTKTDSTRISFSL